MSPPPALLKLLPDELVVGAPGAAVAGDVDGTLDVGVAIGVGVVVPLSNTPPPTPAAKATMTAPPISATLALA